MEIIQPLLDAAKKIGAGYIARVVREETPLDPRTVQTSQHLLDVGTRVLLASAVTGEDVDESIRFIPNQDGPEDTHWWEVVGFTSDSPRPLLRKVGTNEFFTPKLIDGILLEGSVRGMGDNIQTGFLYEVQNKRERALNVIKGILLKRLPVLSAFLKNTKHVSEEGKSVPPLYKLREIIYGVELELLAQIGGGPQTQANYRIDKRAKDTLKRLEDLSMVITEGDLPRFDLYFGPLAIKRKLPEGDGLKAGDCFVALDSVRNDMFYKVVELGKYGHFIATLNEIVPVIENGVAVYSIRELDRYEIRSKELLILLGRPSQDRSASSLWVATQELNNVERFSLEELKLKLEEAKAVRVVDFQKSICNFFVRGLIESEEMKAAQKSEQASAGRSAE